MPVDYKTIISNLMQDLPFISAVCVIEGKTDVVYSTNNWDIKTEIGNLISSWSSMNAESIMISGVKYIMRLCTSERLVASSIGGTGHIIGTKDDERKIIARIEPDGIIGFAYMEMAKALTSLSTKRPYIDESIQLGQKSQMIRGVAPTGECMRNKEILYAKKTQKSSHRKAGI